MRLNFLRSPCFIVLWPCKFILIVLLLIQTVYLIHFLFQSIRIRRDCLKLRKLDVNLQKYPIYQQQNVPTLSKEPLNWIPFDYKIEPECLHSSKTVVVHTKAENFLLRDHVRHVLGREIRPIFVLFYNSTHRKEIEAESEQFRDLLVVSGVAEHYHNITHKTRAWINWLKVHCNSGEVILKLDDDVHVNVNALPILFKIFNKQNSLILCRVFRNGQVVRNPNSKWFLDKNEYNAGSLGNYCQGMAYAFSGNLLPKMVQNMRHVQFLWMDDWYVTHALLNGTHSTYIDIGRHFVSTNSREELLSIFLHNSTIRYEPIFGHFRPNDDGLKSSIEHWDRIQRKFC